MSNTVWSTTVDWICIGSGAGGCGAAIARHDQGLSTLLLEQALPTTLTVQLGDGHQDELVSLLA